MHLTYFSRVLLAYTHTRQCLLDGATGTITALEVSHESSANLGPGSANFGPNPPSSADGRPVKMYCRVHKTYHACEWTRHVAAGAPPAAPADIEDLPMPLKRFSVKASALH